MSDSFFNHAIFHVILMVLVLVGGVNWLLIALFDYNMVTTLFGEGIITTIIYTFVGLAALSMVLFRTTYLPFLGSMSAPCAALQNREPPGATRDVKVIVTPNTKVLYWAAEPASESLKRISMWQDAYQKFENAGVATSNGEGVAILKVRPPQRYKTHVFGGMMPPHVHYRVCSAHGMMEPVRDVFLKEQDPRGIETPVHSNGFADQAESL